LSDRAKTIAKNLAPTNADGKPIDAHLDQRCLACHVTPQAAWDRPNEKPDLAVENWRLGGVSCEACHGPANGSKPWLAEHTAAEKWRNRLKFADKESYGFYDLSDPKRQAVICAGCHVGAAKDEKELFPARDCNHDIMAAGHPRLNFELASFQA